jgi:hypothetical protein
MAKEIKQPELKMGDMPVWFHHHGTKMSVTYNTTHLLGLIIIESSAVILKIEKKSSNVISWLMTMQIIHSPTQKSTNQIEFDKDNLERAFGLRDDFDEFGSSILSEYGGTTGHQGYYIRYKNYLNIPGPGTGHDGDPNVSIKLNDQIKNAIKILLDLEF